MLTTITALAGFGTKVESSKGIEYSFYVVWKHNHISLTVPGMRIKESVSLN